MKILLIGGAGFIGSNLAEEPAKEHEVLVLDNLYLGTLDNLVGSDGRHVHRQEVFWSIIQRKSSCMVTSLIEILWRA